MRRAAALLLPLVVLVPAQPADAVVGRCPRYESLLAVYRLPVRTFSRIMWRESGCQPYARHVNRNGTVDRGLLQINSLHLRSGGSAEGYGPALLYVPRINLQIAARLYKRYGMQPWR